LQGLTIFDQKIFSFTALWMLLHPDLIPTFSDRIIIWIVVIWTLEMWSKLLALDYHRQAL
jgi:hypothetical protein